MLFENIQKIVEEHDSVELKISSDNNQIGIDPLWPRLERAALNQTSDEEATISRYGIWATTVRNNIAHAMELIEAGEHDEGRAFLVRSANALSAFNDIQSLINAEEQREE